MTTTDPRFQITVFVADDSRDDCVLIREALLAEKLADDVRFAGSGDELLKRLETPPLPDLIILDMEMPFKDGRQTLRELQCDERLRDIPVVVMSGSPSEEDRQLAQECGVLAYVTKPETLPGLFKAVRRLHDQMLVASG